MACALVLTPTSVEAQQASTDSGAEQTALQAQVPSATDEVGPDRLRDVIQQLNGPLKAVLPNFNQIYGLARSANASWTHKFRVSVLSKATEVTGTLSVAPDDNVPDGQALLRLDGKIENFDIGSGLVIKNADFKMVVVQSDQGGRFGGDQKLLAALEDVKVGVGDITLDTRISLTDSLYPTSVTLTGDVTLAQIISSIPADSRLNKEFVFKSLTADSQQASLTFETNGKEVKVQKATDARVPGGYEIDVSQFALAASDIAPGADRLPFLKDASVEQLIAGKSGMFAKGYFKGSEFQLTVNGAEKSLVLPSNTLIGDLLPQVADVPALNKAAFQSIAIDGDAVTYKGAYNRKAVTIVSKSTPTPVLEVDTAGLDVSDFISVPGGSSISSLHFQKFILTDSYLQADVALSDLKAVLYATRTAKRRYMVYFNEFDPVAVIPDAKESGLATIGFKNILLVNSTPGDTVTEDVLPPELASLVTLPQGGLSVGYGLGMLGTFDVAGSKQISALLDGLSIKERQFPVHGAFYGGMLSDLANRVKASDLPASTKRAVLSDLNINAPLSLPTVPGLSGIVSPSGPMTLVLKGNGADALAMQANFPVDVTIDGSTSSLVATMSMDKALAGQGSAADVTVALAKPWHEPFGVPGITVNTGSFDFKIGASKDAELVLNGTASYAGTNNVTLKADLKRQQGSIAFEYFEFDASQGFKLSGLPGFSSVPHADAFEVDSVKLSKEGIEAKTKILGDHLDAFIFKDANGGPVFAVDQKGLKLSELMPELKGTKLESMSLNNAAFFVSQSGLSGNPNTLSPIAKDLLKDIFGANSSLSVALPAGIGLVAEVDFKAMADVGKALEKIGVHEDSAVVMGAVTGPFGSGTPSLNLTVVMEKLGEASGMPQQAVKYKPGVTPTFFIKWSGAEIDIGAQTAVNVHAGKETLEFDASVAVAFGTSGLGIDITGAMPGTWHQPFGIKPLTLSDVKLKTGIDDTGQVTLGFKGSQTLGEESATLATEVKFELADAMPTSVAFAGSLNQLGPQTIIEIVEAFDQKGTLAHIQFPFFYVNKPTVAFATPGATDADLGLIAEGVAFKGDLYLMDTNLGGIQGAGGPKGITFSGDVNPLNIGPLALKNNKVNFEISLAPKFHLASNVKLLTAEQKVTLDFMPPTLDFKAEEDLGPGKVVLAVEAKGFNPGSGSFDQNADITFAGEFDANGLVPYLEKIINEGVDDLNSQALAKLDADKQTLENAQKAVDALNDKIKARRDELNREKAAATAKIQEAEDRVNGLNSKVQDQRNEAKNCGNTFTHPFCAPFHELEVVALEGAIIVADGVLEAAKAGVAVAFDLDPQLVGLLAERDLAHAALAVAIAVIDAAEEVEKALTTVIKQEADAVLENIPITVESAFVAGDIRDLVAGKGALVLDMKFKIGDDSFQDYFVFNPSDPVYTAEGLALFPALILEKVVEKVSDKISKDAGDWVKQHIGNTLAAAQGNVQKDVLAAETKFAKVLNSLQNSTERYSPPTQALTAVRKDKVTKLSVTDLQGPSAQFQTTYIAVGHSALCLAVASDGRTVHQEDCKDGDAEKWHTMERADGYVSLVANGLCLTANQYSDGRKDFPLSQYSCNPENEWQSWKVVSYDSLFYQMVNRKTQKCLHFETEAVNPEKAKAVWTSCTGFDSQSFRPIKDAEAVDHITKNAPLISDDDICIGPKDVNYLDANKIQHLVTLVPVSCTDKSVLKWNVQERPDGAVRLVDAADQGIHCLGGRNLGSGAIGGMVVCDRGDDLWLNMAEEGSHFMLFHPTKTDQCFTLDTSVAGFTQCNRQKPLSNQLFQFKQ